MIARRLFVLFLVLLAAVQIVRNAAVAGWAELHPLTAARFWPDHPAVELSRGMVEIAQAARKQQSAGPSAFVMISDAALRAPLAPEPFLVRGVQAQLSGQPDAEQMFLAAQLRDPRSLPAAYFLADYYFRKGDTARGLAQIARLAQLSPTGFSTIAPYIAAYAQNRSNWPLLRKLFKTHPQLEGYTLAALARDPANAGAVVALASPSQRRADSPWVATLLKSLVDSRQYGRARAIWASISGVSLRSDQLIFDSGFSQAAPPPPFNWALTSSTVGVAERQPGGRLHTIFYGQEDGVLASQLLLLPVGHYRIAMQLLGDAAHARPLSWAVRCDKSPNPIASTTLDQAAAHGWSFDIPINCPAQWLELSGSSSDMPQQTDVTIGALRISRAAGA